MDPQVKRLVAVGAAAAANCRPCLEHHVPQCIRAGIPETDIRQAIETGFQVNRGAHAKTHDYVETVIGQAKKDSDENATARKCCC